MDLSISFLLFFGGLSAICALLLYKSIVITRSPNHEYVFFQYHTSLYSWHTPNLKKWKEFLYSILYWARDISFRYWTVWLLGRIKYVLYRVLRSIHMRLLGTIKFLERQEDQLKSRLAEKGTMRSATEQRLIRTLTRKKFPTQPTVSLNDGK